MNGTAKDCAGATLRLHSSASSRNQDPLPLRVGDLVGRHAGCALQLQYPRAPLVAACVVRRGRRIFLEGQGLHPQVGPHKAKRIRLIQGAFIPIGDVTIEVIAVRPPIRVIGVAVADFALQELVAPYYALRGGSAPDLVPGEIAHPDAEIVNAGTGWRIAQRGGGFETLTAGGVWHAGGTRIRTAWMDTRSPAVSMMVEPLTIEAGDGSALVQIARPRRHRVTLRGKPALLLRSGARGDRRINPALFDSRDAFTAALEDLWDALRAHGLRDDLVRDDGNGSYELNLRPDDRLEYVRGGLAASRGPRRAGRSG